MLRVSAASLEYVRVKVKAMVEGVAYNPTSDNVSFAFTGKGGITDTTTWVSGLWETVGKEYFALCLIGPGAEDGAELTQGRYTVWVKIEDNPEAPVKESGELEIY